MKLWQLQGPDRRVLVMAETEDAAREHAAGRGKDRDERWMSHDHASCDPISVPSRGGIVLDEKTANEPASRKAKDPA